ncbi:unnamed protein product [Discosporangium mesarthrocarpum]
MRPAMEVVLDLAGAGGTGAQGKALIPAVQRQMVHWKPLLSNLKVEPGDDLEMIKVVEGYALRPECEKSLRAVFRYVLQLLLNEEMVDEECLMRWVTLRRSTPGETPERKLFDEREVQDFVEWLEEEEEEDDDEDEDEDDGSSEDFEEEG